MIDAYYNLFKKYDKNLFFKDGLEQIIYINEEAIENQWTNKKNDQLIFIIIY